MLRVPRALRALALTVTGLCVVFSPSPAEPGQRRDMNEENKRRDQSVNDRGRYEAMIEAYRAGDTAQSVALLADPEWDETRLKMLRSGLAGAPPGPPYADVLWRAAPMMHIDVALHLSPRLEQNDDQAGLHLGMAEELLRLGIRMRGDAIRPFAERLYVALARLLQDRLAPYSAERVLKVARELIPDRAPVLYASGTLAELFATDYALIGNSVLYTASSGRTLQIKKILERRTGNLADALRWLRRAAELDPGNDLLRVHLGRVLALRRDDDEALAVLGNVVAATGDAAVAYVASMFVGGLRERQGDLEAAAAAYRTAGERFRQGHAAPVALSEVLQRLGKGDEARDVLRAGVTEENGPTREPLWWYQFDPPGFAAARLAEIRAEVRR